MKIIYKVLFSFLFVFTLFGCMQNKKSNTVDFEEEQKVEIYNLAVESGYNGTYEEWLASIRGASIVLQVSNGYIQWASTDKSLWHNLVSLDELVGKDGKDGQKTEFRVDSGYIQWKYTGDSTWTNLISLADLTGQDGKNIELKVNNYVIQWKQEESNNWQDLISLSSLSGEDGLTPEFKNSETYILWKYTIEADSEWRELVSKEELKGETGKDGRTPEFRVYEGYMQWKYTDEDDTNWVNIMPYYTPEKEMVTVTFDYGNGVVDSRDYEKGSTIEEPTAVKDGNKVSGQWLLNGKIWEFDFYVVTKDITLNLAWDVAPKYVFINSYTNEVIATYYAFEGENVEIPEVSPSKEYKIYEWYDVDNNLSFKNNIKTFESYGTLNQTYYIKSRYENAQPVYFIVGNEIYYNTSGFIGDVIMLPEKPEVGELYEFINWYYPWESLSPETTEILITSSGLNNDMRILYANFKYSPKNINIYDGLSDIFDVNNYWFSSEYGAHMIESEESIFKIQCLDSRYFGGLYDDAYLVSFFSNDVTQFELLTINVSMIENVTCTIQLYSGNSIINEVVKEGTGEAQTFNFDLSDIDKFNSENVFEIRIYAKHESPWENPEFIINFAEMSKKS